MMLWVLLWLQPFISMCEGCVSETCGGPPQPAEASDAFASIQVIGKQTTEQELDDKVVVEHIYKLNEDGTVTIIFKYEDGTEEVFDVLDPNSPGLLQEQRSQEGFPWKKILKIKKIKEALDRRRQDPSTTTTTTTTTTSTTTSTSSCRSGDISFSFLNAEANDPAQGIVTGCISGLLCNNNAAQATSVRVLTNEAGFGLGEYISADQNVATNTFNVNAGCEIVKPTNFNSAGNRSLSLNFIGTLPVPCAGLSNSLFVSVRCETGSDQVKFQYIS
ncbi:unnamed protein product [Cladocopium goreaui]|uniref:Uncharacterized protein n=1 Tax=Cladocopium goreaui TaxID=2562237 RepID=A0A9P1BKF4_9DINO|nr:unnamed protein product [Cladocopium goreaui]